MYLSVKRYGKSHRVLLIESSRGADGKVKKTVIQDFGRRDQMPDDKFNELKAQYSSTSLRRAVTRRQRLSCALEAVKHAAEEDEGRDMPIPCAAGTCCCSGCGLTSWGFAVSLTMSSAGSCRRRTFS